MRRYGDSRRQPQCRDLVALGLNENFETLAFAVNGTPHVHLASGDRDHHFVEMPTSVRCGLFSRKFLAMIGPNLSTHRRIDALLSQPALRQEVRDIPVASVNLR